MTRVVVARLDRDYLNYQQVSSSKGSANCNGSRPVQVAAGVSQACRQGVLLSSDVPEADPGVGRAVLGFGRCLV